MSTVPFRVLKLAQAIQQIPAPTFAEAERAEFVRQAFNRAGLLDVGCDQLHNVYARLPGASPGVKPLLVTAHTDTVFPAGTDLALRHQPGRIFGPGLGDNALGVAGLLGLVWALHQRGAEPPGDIWLSANVGEEGLGDLAGMRAVVRRFGERVRATLVLEGMALGHVYRQAIGVRRYQIGVRTEGGHSWLRFGKPSAIHVLMRLGAQIAALEVPYQPRTTFNIGVIAGGTSVNTIAGEASFQLDLRSEEPAELGRLAARVEALANALAGPEVEISLRVIGDRPAGELPADHPLVRLALRSLNAVGFPLPALEAGSTDANLPLSLGQPCVCIGLSRGGNAHTSEEYIETEPLADGLRALTLTALGTFEI
ncbi:MAG: M20/M25/M40 family metallo-hydrolase [Chloroflexi bacterium]|nr:M20/M25/M40 family metallo-hydrolase [Chloroflexota bacterium]